MNSEIKLRAATIVVRENSVILVNHQHEGFSYWIPPGGKVEFGEEVEEAAIREVKEETGVDVEIERLLFYRDFIRPKKENHVFELFFLADSFEGEIELGEDPEISRENQMLKGVEIVEKEDLKDYRILPEILRYKIEEGLESGFSREAEKISDL